MTIPAFAATGKTCVTDRGRALPCHDRGFQPSMLEHRSESRGPHRRFAVVAGAALGFDRVRASARPVRRHAHAGNGYSSSTLPGRGGPERVSLIVWGYPWNSVAMRSAACRQAQVPARRCAAFTHDQEDAAVRSGSESRYIRCGRDRAHRVVSTVMTPPTTSCGGVCNTRRRR